MCYIPCQIKWQMSGPSAADKCSLGHTHLNGVIFLTWFHLHVPTLGNGLNDRKLLQLSDGQRKQVRESRRCDSSV